MAQRFPNLKVLVANNNKIEKIGMEGNTKQEKLTELNLSDNKITTVENFFNIFNSVEDMDLSSNPIKQLELPVMKELKVLKLIYCTELEKINLEEAPKLFMSQLAGDDILSSIHPLVLSSSEHSNCSGWRDTNGNVFWSEMMGRRHSQEDSIVCVVEEFKNPSSGSDSVNPPFSLFSVFDGYFFIFILLLFYLILFNIFYFFKFDYYLIYFLSNTFILFFIFILFLFFILFYFYFDLLFFILFFTLIYFLF